MNSIARAIATWLMVGCLGCAPTVLVAQRTVAPKSTQAHHIAVLVSERNPIYDEVLTGFEAAFQGQVSVFTDVNSETTTKTALRNTLDAGHFSLLVVLGDGAARLVWDAKIKTTVLFAAVVSPEELGVLGGNNYMGVSMATPTVAAFTRFRGFAPKMNNVLALYAGDSMGRMLEQAQRDLHTMGIELKATKIGNLDDVKAELAGQRDWYDAVWLVPDPVLVNPATFAMLKQTALADKKILLSTLSEKFTEAGALMSVSTDFRSMGSQAALLAFRVLEQSQAASDIGLHPPVGAKLSVNLGVARSIDLEVTPEAMMLVGHAFR